MKHEGLGTCGQREGQISDWNRGIEKEATRRLYKATASGCVFFLLFVAAAHTSATFIHELRNPVNEDTTTRAKIWLRRICINETELPRDAFISCEKYKDWMSRSTTMNALRITLHTEIDALQSLWVRATGWLFTWDPFYTFQIKLLVNSLCSSLTMAIPILTLLSLLYIALLFKGPICELRYWFGLQTSSLEVPVHGSQQALSSINQSTEQYTKHNAYNGRNLENVRERWASLTDQERETLTQCVMKNIQANRGEHHLT
jgi:hypothetical protein